MNITHDQLFTMTIALSSPPKHLIPTLQHVLFLLSPTRERRKWYARASYRTIAERLGLSRRTIERHFAQLKHLGYLKLQSRFSSGFRLSNLIRLGGKLKRILIMYKHSTKKNNPVKGKNSQYTGQTPFQYAEFKPVQSSLTPEEKKEWFRKFREILNGK